MAVLNKVPPQWYEVWRRPDSSSFALGVCIVWLLVFLAEQQFSVWPGLGLQPDSHTNVALGALDLASVARGQWWRFFTNPFLHGGPNHLISDILALIGVGATFQAIVGRAWFAAAFALIALGTGAISFLGLPTYSMGTIGPMGTVMGILTANFICGFHFEEIQLRIRIWKASFQSLLAAMIATFQPQGFPVDISGHIGGTVCGLVLGCGLLLAWPKDQAKPRFERAALLFARLFGAAAVAGCLATAVHYQEYVTATKQSIPAFKRSLLNEKDPEKLKELVYQYPNDSYGHLFLSYRFFNLKDWSNAELESRAALTLASKSVFGPENIDDERAVLALSLFNQQRGQEAALAIAPSCNSKNPDPIFQESLKALKDHQLCDVAIEAGHAM